MWFLIMILSSGMFSLLNPTLRDILWLGDHRFCLGRRSEADSMKSLFSENTPQNSLKSYDRNAALHSSNQPLYRSSRRFKAILSSLIHVPWARCCLLGERMPSVSLNFRLKIMPILQDTRPWIRGKYRLMGAYGSARQRSLPLQNELYKRLSKRLSLPYREKVMRILRNQCSDRRARYLSILRRGFAAEILTATHYVRRMAMNTAMEEYIGAIRVFSSGNSKLHLHRYYTVRKPILLTLLASGSFLSRITEYCKLRTFIRQQKSTGL